MGLKIPNFSMEVTQPLHCRAEKMMLSPYFRNEGTEAQEKLRLVQSHGVGPNPNSFGTQTQFF